MKFSNRLMVIAVVASMQFSFASSLDTIDLVGGWSYDIRLGWFGEAWCDSAKRWYGDTLYKDTTVEMVITSDTTKYPIKTPVDTIINGTDTSYVTNDTSYIDSTDVLLAPMTVFNTDTGGFTAGAQYINFYYKFRDWWAQCPVVWNNWQGTDAGNHKTMIVVYKGPLATHRMKLDFFYAAWGPYLDTTKDKEKKGDGVGVLSASPAGWTTKIITVPDSVDLVGITGLTFNLENAPGVAVGTSEVGNLKIARISLVGESSPVKNSAFKRGSPADRFQFIPATPGRVTVTICSLKGETLYTTSLGVEANKAYSVRQLAKRYSGAASSQVRLLRIKGAGIDLYQQIW